MTTADAKTSAPPHQRSRHFTRLEWRSEGAGGARGVPRQQHRLQRGVHAVHKPCCFICQTASDVRAPQELVAHAKRNGSIIVYDAAYALYISDRNCPKSIFEIEGGLIDAVMVHCRPAQFLLPCLVPGTTFNKANKITKAVQLAESYSSCVVAERLLHQRL